MALPVFSPVVIVGERRRSKAVAAAAASAFVLVTVLVVLLTAPSSDLSGSRLADDDLRGSVIARSTKVSIPPSEDPNVGTMFGKLIMLGFDAVVELKRALKGHRLHPDYDATDKVAFVETMLHHLVRDLNVDEMPPPKLGGRQASFLIAVKKVELLHRLVREIPVLPEVDNMRASRYAVIKFNVQQISAALDRIIAELEVREFAALEPKDSSVGHLLNKINRAKIDTDAPVFKDASWKDVNTDISKHLFEGSVQGQSTAGGISDGLHAPVNVDWDDDDADDSSSSASTTSNNNNKNKDEDHVSRRNVEKMQKAVQRASLEKRGRRRHEAELRHNNRRRRQQLKGGGGNFEFEGTMDQHGNLVGELIPTRN